MNIQQAINDASQRGGGVVTIPAGLHMLRDALHLRSKVTVRGEDGAILKREKSVASPLLDCLGYGFREFTVTQPEKFDVGMGVHLFDKNAVGFYTTVATIVARDGNTFFTNRPFSHDYIPTAGAQAVSLFSIVEGENVRDAAIENLILDGNDAEDRVLNGCRGAGVFLIGSQGVRLQNIEVRNYNGDGISFQQCRDIAVLDCQIHHNSGSGLHPGSGSVRYVLSGNHIHDNGGYGVFYCLRTTHSICEGNVLEKNAKPGVSFGERDSDHLIRGNTIRGNVGPGVIFRHLVVRGGDRVQIEANKIGPNRSGAEGSAEITFVSPVQEVYIRDNEIECTDLRAFELTPRCTDIFIVDNRINGRVQKAADIGGDAASAQLSSPTHFPETGPEALPLEGARHLGIETLRPWPEALSRLAQPQQK